VADPRRIVSLVPSHTESLHDLGLGDRVVGRTRFCIHPSPWVDGIPAVGGTKDAKLERILALQPDLVVADKDENPKALVDALQSAGVPVLWSEIDSVPDAAAFLEELGEACGVPDTGHVAAQATLRTMMDVRQEQGERAPIPVFCPIWHAPWMTFDRTAYPHAMLEAVGLANVFAGQAGTKYFEVAAADVARSGAQWSLLPTEPFPFHKQRDKVDTSTLGACGRPERVRIVDGEALTWFGTRTVRGLRELAHVAAQLRVAST
jgi:ABC-type hemin transport system substrate-binding protein